MLRPLIRLIACASVVLACGRAGADEPTPAAVVTFREIALLTSGLRTGPVGSRGRTAVHRDPIEARLVRGTWVPPKAGETLTSADGEVRAWAEVKADDKGAFTGAEYEEGSYVSLSYESSEAKVVLLHAVGNDFVYVNGEMRPGDPYGYGWLRLPVVVRRGANEFLVRASRGSLRVTLEEPSTPVYLSPDDATIPMSGGPVGLVVVNTTRASMGVVAASKEATDASSGTKAGPALLLGRIGPLTIRKVATEVDSHSLLWRLRVGESELPTGGFVPPGKHASSDPISTTTFRSDIDGSIQYYASRSSGAPARSLVLSLHGASVEATGQANAYGDMPGRAIVCPTNRRPYGFDWEDWGRLDALEVLELAKARFKPSPDAIYLTGHSMGGHGTWHLGATYPDQFAAIGPSAGWISFSTYAGGPTDAPVDAVDEILRRASNPSDTRALATNLASTGVYILHGDADDNVPVTQAREMAKILGVFHKDWRLFEQPGAGHWWDVSKAPGADCVDWPPMYEFFARRRLPPSELVTDIDFTTMDPGVSSRCHGVTIVRQTKALAPSRIQIRRSGRRFDVRVENVEIFTIADANRPELTVNGQVVPVDMIDGPTPGAGPGLVWAHASGARESYVLDEAAGVKCPSRGGSFKTAFRNHFRLVYGTTGSVEESAASYARARLDAETWYYRGNGGAEVLSDVDLLAESGRRDENLILYGNADTNGAWGAVLDGCPVRVGRGKITVGAKTIEGDDLGCLLVYPRANSGEALVGVVGGTGPVGLRVTERLPIFTSGVGFPDVTILDADVLERGNAGVRGAGFFGNDWSVERGEFAWHEAAPAPSLPTPLPSEPPVPIPGMDSLPR